MESLLGQIFSSKIIRGSYSDEKPLVDAKIKGSNQEQKRMTALLNKIAKYSELGKSVLEDAVKSGFEFSFEPQLMSSGFCSRENGNKIVLSPLMNDATLVATLAHETRHAQQMSKGCPDEFGQHTVKSEVMLFRAMEADAQAIALMTTMEIRQNSGDAQPYEKFCQDSPEIAGAIPQIIKSGKMKFKPTPVLMQAAFEGWYKNSDIVTAYESGYICGPMKNAIRSDKYSDVPYDKQLKSSEIVEMFCHDAQGKCYIDDKELLNQNDKLSLCQETKATISDFFTQREKYTGKKPDTSHIPLPTRRETFLYENGYPIRRISKLSKMPTVNVIQGFQAKKER